MIKIISIQVLLVLLSAFFFTSNVHAQNGKMKCPNKKSFWKNNARKSASVKLPHIDKPSLPNMSMPKIGKFNLPKFQKVKLPEVSTPKMPQLNLDIKKGRSTASTNCPKRVY